MKLINPSNTSIEKYDNVNVLIDPFSKGMWKKHSKQPYGYYNDLKISTEDYYHSYTVKSLARLFIR